MDDLRDHPYMRPSPFMHLPGQLPAANVQLLKDGRLAPTGMEGLQDICQQGWFFHCGVLS